MGGRYLKFIFNLGQIEHWQSYDEPLLWGEAQGVGEFRSPNELR